MAGTPPPTQPKLARRFDYTNVEDTKEARTKAKNEQLRANPDILYEHTKKTGYICSLIFYTKHREAWKDTILKYYPGATMGETPEKVSLILGKGRGTILVFKSGKFLINDNCDMVLFKKQFEDMKRDVMERNLKQKGIKEEEEGKKDEEEGEEKEEKEAAFKMPEAPQSSTDPRPMFEDLKKDVLNEEMSKMCLEGKEEDCEPTRSRAERGGGSGGGGRRVKSRCERDDEVVKEMDEEEDEGEEEEEEEEEDDDEDEDDDEVDLK